MSVLDELEGTKFAAEKGARLAKAVLTDRASELKNRQLGMRSAGNATTPMFEFMSGKYRSDDEGIGGKLVEGASRFTDLVAGGIGEMGRKMSTGEESSLGDAALATVDMPGLGLAGMIGGKKGLQWLEATAPDLYKRVMDRGTWKGVDDKQRMWIDDSKASLKSGTPKLEVGQETLGDVLDHEDLFKAYPFLKDIKMEELASGGRWSKARNTIGIAKGFSEQSFLSTLLHEIQHSVQTVEGFAKGGSASKKGVDKKKAFDEYLKLAGENESRLVEYIFNRSVDPTAPDFKKISEEGLTYSSKTDDLYIFPDKDLTIKGVDDDSYSIKSKGAK